MMCPKCKKQGAYLYSEDGITEFGIQEVTIRHDCSGLENIYPDDIASVTINVSRKRGTTELLEVD